MTGISRHDILARHKEDEGLLKGKIISDTTIPVKTGIHLMLVKKFSLPDANNAFKTFCNSEIDVGFKKPQRMLPAVHSFVESCYRGLPYGAMLVDLVFMPGSEIYLAVKASGHYDARRFGGRDAQAQFDDTANFSKPEISRAYRTREYLLTATLFKDMQELDTFVQKHFESRGGGDLLKQSDATPLKQLTFADSLPVSERIPQKWFGANINTWVPTSFIELLDDDAIKLLFPPGLLDRIRGKQSKAAKLVIPKESRTVMLQEVRSFYSGYVVPKDDEELLTFHSDIPTHTEVEYDRQYAMSVRVKCELDVHVRTPR